MSCDPTRRLLPAYGDNELSVESALDVERHLQDCAQCRVVLSQQRRFAESLARLYPRAPLPADLEERVQLMLRTPVGKRYWVNTLALAASVLLAFSALWQLLRPTPVAMPSTVLAAAQVHRSALAHELPLALQSSEPTAVNAWLRTTLPFVAGEPVRATTADLVLQGAAFVNLAGERVGYVQYGTGARVVSLLLLQPREWPRGSEPVRVHDMEFHFYTVDGLKLIAWNHAPLSYVLVSDLGGHGARACVVCHSGAADTALRSFADQGLI